MIALMMFLFIAGPKVQNRLPSCLFAGNSVPCDPAYIPKLVRKDGVCPIREGYDIPNAGVVCINGFGYVIDVNKPQYVKPKAHKAKIRKHVGKACADPDCTNHSPAMPSGEIFGHTEPTKDDPVTFYEYIQHPQHEQLEESHDKSQDMQFGTYCDWGGCTDTTDSISVTAPGGSKAVKLSDSEYSHLQTLRKAVADEEKRLATKYGAKPSCWDKIPKGSDAYCYDGAGPDHFEYHGQFLLIEKVR
jgi:hypothetical protein